MKRVFVSMSSYISLGGSIKELKKIKEIHILNSCMPDDLSQYTRKIQKAMNSCISDKSHDEIFEGLKKRYEA